MRTYPQYARTIDAYLDHLSEGGVEQFTARSMAEWYVDMLHRRGVPPSPRRRQQLVRDTVGQVSGWLQQYWQAASTERYRYFINSMEYGPGATWEYTDERDVAKRTAWLATRVTKNLKVTWTNAVQRSVLPHVQEERREDLMESLDVGIDLMLAEIEQALS